jgi:hypothetical protein
MNANNPINFSSIPTSINPILREEATIQIAAKIHSLTATIFSSVIVHVHQKARSLYTREIGFIRKNPTTSALIICLSSAFMAVYMKYRKIINSNAEIMANQLTNYLTNENNDLVANNDILQKANAVLIRKNENLSKDLNEIRETLLKKIQGSKKHCQGEITWLI